MPTTTSSTPPKPTPAPSRFHALHAFLDNASATGHLANAHPDARSVSLFSTFLYTIPWHLLLLQTLWSSLITTAAYFLGRRSTSLRDTFSVAFWHSRLNVSSTVANGVGWALFILLGFFIREASSRYSNAFIAWNRMSAHLQHIMRHLIQAYSDAHWHPHAMDRIVAHLIAYPIALKMSLRSERHPQQLSNILSKQDVDDVLAADTMHLHCLQVVRAYLLASNRDVLIGFDMPRKPSVGKSILEFLPKVVDQVDQEALQLLRTAHFHPAVGYVNHLRIFMYIWLFFLPLNLVEISGWFTVLFAVLISYGVAMIFYIATALNDPFGYDVQDLKLNAMAADTARDLVNMFHNSHISLSSIVTPQHDTPTWLEQPLNQAPSHDRYHFHQQRSSAVQIMTYLRHIGRRLLYPQIYIPAILFALWCAFVVLLTYFLARGTAKTNAPSCRWWCLYIPINSSVTSYVSLGVFVLLSFWMNDAYARYWRGLQVWQTELRPNIPQLAFQFAFMAKRGLWHPRDRERLLSHFAALPIVCKQHLRYSRDLSELNDILSPADIRAIAHADHMVRYMMHVFYAYWNSVDTQHKETCLSQTHPLAVFKRANQFWVLERSLLTCDEIRDVQLPVALTLHLQIFTAIWLAFLPLSIVQQNGFLSFLYLLPISYSILNLLQLGKEFADPFGTDPFDIPLHDFCEEIKVAVHEVYTDMENGRQKFIRPSDYCRASFTPHPCSKEQTGESGSSESTLSFSSVIRMFLASLPSVSVTSMVVSIVWSVSGTMISWGLQFVWSEARRKQCRYWCSPVDVDKGTLRNIGFALFLILSFRAADAMGRFQDGANNLCILSQQLRSLSVEFCQNVQDGLLHACEKERFVAHVAQIPLLFRDILLGENRDFASREGLLSDEDWNTFTSSEDPLEHLLRTVEAYVMMTTMSDAAESMMKLPMTTMTYLRGLMGVRVRLIRETIWTILSVKRHPVVAAYISHQKMFTALWLFLLPLSMTSSTGFFTILWVPIISFGVLGLENIVVELVDPFGDDDVDIPVDEFCRNVSSEVVEAANSIDWNCDKLTVPTGKPESPTIGSTLCGKEVKAKYSLAYFEEHDATTENFGDESTVFFRGDDEFKEKPNLFAHFVRSVPWWVIVAVTVWAALATLISYFAREDNEGQRWWQSQFTIDSEVAKYLSFAAFMLVAFYVQEAFRRYERAGEAWNEELKARCHTMAASWVSLFGRDARHEGDHERAFSFIAAIPVILKHQLRDGRDLRELKGLLSASDILALQCSSNMVQHAIDVLRSYLLLGANFPDRLANRDDWYAGARIILMRDEIVDLERTVKDLLLLNAFPIPPAFVSLLCTLIGIWFLTLPFVLAEVSGWFTILWVPLIGYGILGMYAIAGELQDPFGTDMNDLDLDGAADAIVKDVLFVQKNYKNGNGCFIVDNPGHPSWSEGKKEGQLASDGLKGLEELSVGSSLRLALHAIPLWMLLAFSIWAAVNMTGSWLVAKYWPFLGAAAEKCKPWWCSRIAVSGSVKEYLGFALFLLLGFRLYDSHFRFVEGLRYWKELIGLTHTMTSRLFQTYPRGYWHDGDHQRIAGHITGAGIALMGALRGEGCDRDRLRQVLCDGDAVRVELASDPVHYCIDVVRGYLAEGDRRQELKKLKLTRTCPESEQRVLGKCLRDMTARLRACEGIVSVPLAFGYVTHLRIVLVIWLLLLPLGVVESSGWLGIAWSVLIFYGLVGIERWSDELSDPFGLDLSDVPLEALVEELEAVVRSNLELMKHSNVPFIESGVSRTPFPEAEEQKEELVSSAAD